MIGYIYYHTSSPAVTIINWLLWLIALGAAVAVLVDAARRPDWQFQASGHSKGLWIGLGIGSIVLCCFCIPAWIIAGIYFISIRPQLENASRQGPNSFGGYGAPMGGFGVPGPYPPPPPPMGGYPAAGSYPPPPPPPMGGFPGSGGYPPPPPPMGGPPGSGGYPPPPSPAGGFPTPPPPSLGGFPAPPGPDTPRPSTPGGAGLSSPSHDDPPPTPGHDPDAAT